MSVWMDMESYYEYKKDEEGRKNDTGKAPVVRGVMHAFPDALSAIASLAAVGAVKYSWDNWKVVPDGFNRYSDAMCRHLLKEPHVYDDGPGGTEMLHIIQTAWNSLARLQLYLEQHPDRPIKKPPKE